MKKIYLVLTLCTLFLVKQASAQCTLTPNNVTLDCSTPCATLTVTPMPLDYNATNTYSVSSIPFTPYSYTTGTLLPALSDDVYSNVIPLPFPFCYFGTTYNSVLIGSNANLCFDLSLAGAYDPWPISGPIPGSNSDATMNAIMFSWMDYLNTSGGGIYYTTYGVAPCRVFVVSYNNVAYFSCTSTHGSQQVVLHEGTNVIEMHTQNKPVCSGWNSGNAVTGIENASGATFFVAPGENGVSFSVSNESWRFAPAGATSPWTYTWTGPGGAVVGTGTSVTVCPTITATYTITATTAACTGGVAIRGVATVTKTSSATPILGTPSMCLGYTTSLSNITTGGTWNSAAPGVAAIDGTGLVTSVSGGTATISYTVAGCTSTIIVTVNTAPAISGIAPICIGGTTTLTDAVTGGTWTSSNPGVATIGLSSGVVTGISPGTTTITYVTPAGCVTTAVETVVVLSPITGPNHVCQGNNITLYAGSTGGSWTSSNAAVASISAGGILTGLSGGTTNITYTTAGGCFVNTTITVNPVAPITGIMDMCQNFTTVLSNALPGGVWTSNNPSVATVNSATGVVTGINGGTSGVGNTATIVYTLPTGCTMSTVVTIHPKPAPPTPAAPFRYCQFDPSGPVSASGVNLLWYGAGVITNTIAPTPVTSLPATFTYYVTQTSSYGCVSDSAIDVITIYPQPAPPVTHDTLYCQYYNGFIMPLNYEVDSATGSSLKWYSASGTLLSGAPTPSTSSPTYPAGTTWNVSQVVNGCESPQAPVKVTIVPTPKFDIIYRNWVCQHDSIILSFNLTSGSILVSPIYYWSLPTGASATNGTSQYDPTVEVKFDAATSTYNVGYLTIGNLNGQCSTTDTFSVRVVPQPHAHGHCKPDICQGDTVNLALSEQSSNAASFNWFVDGTPLASTSALNIISANSNSGGPFRICWNDSGRHIITVHTSTHEGCRSDPTNDSINVHAKPDAFFTLKPKHTGSLCLEDSILFSARHQDANASYLWEPEHCFNNNNKANIWGKVEQGRTEVTLTVTTPFGCKSMYSEQLNPDACCTVLFPSAFSPNGDGRNDRFQPIFTGYHNFHQFRVVNRWGQTVFQSANSNPSWDGYMNGVPQDMGVYYFYIKYDCGGNTIEEKGDCTLVR